MSSWRRRGAGVPGKLEKIWFMLKKFKRDFTRKPLFYALAEEVHAPELGEYYFVMTEAELRAGVSQNFHFDAEGIPLIPTYIDVEERKLIYYPISIGQYGLAIFHTWLKSGAAADRQRFLAIADWFYENRISEERRGDFWLTDVPKPEYRIFDPWPSAFAQSRGISILLRGYQLTGAEKYLSAATNALKIFEVPAGAGGVTTFSEYGPLYEEYPAPFPTVVLDGLIFSLFGLFDYVRVMPDHQQARRLFDAGTAALKQALPAFDLGYWIRYNLCREDFYPRLDPATIGYFRLINTQLQLLSRMSGEDSFRETAARWARYDRRVNHFRMYRAKYRALRRMKRL